MAEGRHRGRRANIVHLHNNVMNTPQNIVRLRILAAALALGEFTAPELAAYAGANVHTVRSQLRRDADLFEQVPYDEAPRRPGRITGRPPNRWRVTDHRAVLELLQAFDMNLAPLRPPVATVGPDEQQAGAHAALTVAENALLDAWKEGEDDIRALLFDTARNTLQTARAQIAATTDQTEATGSDSLARRAAAVEALLDALSEAHASRRDASRVRRVAAVVGELASTAGWARGADYTAQLVELALGVAATSVEHAEHPVETHEVSLRGSASGTSSRLSHSHELGLVEKTRLVLGHGLHSVKTLAEAGLVRPERPDRTIRALLQIQRWGYTPAAGYAANASRYANDDAIIDELGRLTFAEVNDRTNRLANAWSDAGIVEGDSIGVMCRNHRYFIESVVAASKMGVNCLLLSTAFAGPQLAEVVQREKPVALVYDEEFSELLEEAGERRKRFIGWYDSEATGEDRESNDPVLEDLIEAGDPEQPMPPAETGRVVILTSGTTGTPKGASRKPPETIAPAVALLSHIPLRAREKTFIVAPLFHSWGFALFTLGLMLGSTHVLKRKFDPEDTLSTIAEHQVQCAPMVPVMVQRIMQLPEETRRKYDLSSLTSIPLSGSALPGELAIQFMDEFGDLLYNVYGSSEVAWATIATPEDLREAPGTAGVAPRGTVLRVYDVDGSELPQGETGRIFVGNEMLFEGYTGGGDTEVIDGLMSTGDVGYVDEEGRLHVSGRDDDMIVWFGENVFPREVEDLISKMDGVNEVAVIGVEDEEFGQRLKAFVSKRGAKPTEDDIKAKVKSDLAGYKVPKEVEFLDELPRNAIGTVLKDELKEREDAEVGREGSHGGARPAPSPDARR
jgi:acyl-CoA synthetase (AMP-forming)/AMP-acid ligase II